MELFDGSMWYEAEQARSGHSKCKEFRCKETIEEGVLRIGIKTEAHDHGGDTLGWYHPKCLWKTFCYKSNANPRITKLSDIVNYRSLDDEEREVFTALIHKNTAGAAPPVAGVKRELGADINVHPAVEKGSVALSVAGDELVVSGDTFCVKDTLQAAGGVWNGANKVWMYSAAHRDTVLALFKLVAPPAPGQSKTMETRQLQAAAGGGPVLVAPKYAMAGTVVFQLVQNTQDIDVRGNTEHIASRLRAAGGTHQTTQWAMAEYWKFPTQSRAGARKFFCMPDDLPPADTYIEIDLADLGRKQVRCQVCILLLKLFVTLWTWWLTCGIFGRQQPTERPSGQRSNRPQSNYCALSWSTKTHRCWRMRGLRWPLWAGASQQMQRAGAGASDHAAAQVRTFIKRSFFPIITKFHDNNSCTMHTYYCSSRTGAGSSGR